MSNALGCVKFPDNTILYCEYSGTVDVMHTKLYDTPEEMYDNWRKQDPHENYKVVFECQHEPQEIEIVSTYGRGFSWNGNGCKECKCILDNVALDHKTITNGLPDWFPIKDFYKF